MPVLSSHIYALGTVVLWSSAYVITKMVLQSFSPSALGLLRCLTASLVLLAIAALGRIARPAPRDIPLLVLTGAAGFACYMLLFNKGSQSLSPTASCLIISTAPIMTAGMAAFAFRERLSLAGWIAIAAAFGGIVIMTRGNSGSALSTGPDGALWMAVAALSISLYTLLQRSLVKKYSALAITVYSFLAGTLLLLPFLPQALAQVQQAPVQDMVLVLFLGVFPSAAAYVLWARALSTASSTASVTNYMFLTPFLAMILEYAIMAQLPGADILTGGGIILASLVLFTLRGKP